MGKSIIFCADGTWNGPDDHGDGVVGGNIADRTNVYKLFANLAGMPEADPGAAEQERSVFNAGGKQVQIAKYLHGVGNTDNVIMKWLGGTVGAGLIARIVRGFTFISRNYLAGDRIYIAGFSRGAYTARALAGLISARGLLDATNIDLTDKDHAYRLGLAVWFDYRRQINSRAGLLGSLRGIFDRLILPYLDHAESKLISHVPIEAVAVWDTVGSLGIPIYDGNRTLDFFEFTDMRLPAAVRVGIHAVATDEQRMTFTPTLWDDDPRVTQVLFPGAHSNVGGGYPDVGLSDTCLAWMVGRLAALGVQFATKPAYAAGPDSGGMAHRPWLPPPWCLLGVGPRTFPEKMCISASLHARMQLASVPVEDMDPAKYAPTNAHVFKGQPFSAAQIIA
jgi:uncharacterized protein (DUF2235 family)